MTRADLMRSALSVPGLTHAQARVLAHLAYWAKGDPPTAWRPRHLLATETGANPKTVQQCIARLRDLGYLSIGKQARKGTALTLVLHPDRWPAPAPPKRTTTPDTPDPWAEHDGTPGTWGAPWTQTERDPPGWAPDP